MASILSKVGDFFSEPFGSRGRLAGDIATLGASAVFRAGRDALTDRGDDSSPAASPSESIPEVPATREPTPEERAMWAAATEFQQKATEIMDTNFQRGTRIWDYWVNDYLGTVDPETGAATGERAVVRSLFAGVDPQQAVEGAVADVGQQFDIARGIRSRNRARLGIVPGSGREDALAQRESLAEAAARAGAATAARRNVQSENEARRMTAVNLGRSLIPISAGLSGQAVSAGAAGVNALAAPAQMAANREEAALGRQFAAAENERSRAFSAQQAALDRSAQDAASRRAARSGLFGSIGGLVGTGLGFALAPATGGASLLAAGVGGGIGSTAGRAAAGVTSSGQIAPLTRSSYLNY